MTHICVGNLTIIGSDNGLSPGRRQAIIQTNAGILLIGPLGTNFSEILIGIQTFSIRKMHLKMSSAKWRPFCLGLNVLISEWNKYPCQQYIGCQMAAIGTIQRGLQRCQQLCKINSIFHECKCCKIDGGFPKLKQYKYQLSTYQQGRDSMGQQDYIINHGQQIDHSWASFSPTVIMQTGYPVTANEGIDHTEVNKVTEATFSAGTLVKLFHIILYYATWYINTQHFKFKESWTRNCYMHSSGFIQQTINTIA